MRATEATAPDVQFEDPGVDFEASTVEMTPEDFGNRDKASIDMQIATARRFPRQLSKVIEDVKTIALYDQETAQGMFYALKRGGKTLIGPSVRFAEVVASCWGNLRCDSRIARVERKVVVAHGMTWDLEKNHAIGCEVQRRITTKTGSRYGDDMIAVTANAASSIAMRNSVFRVVPFAFFKPVFEEAKRIAAGEGRPVGERIKAALDWFEAQGVEEAKVLQYTGRRTRKDIGFTDIILLSGLKTAIEEGTTTVAETFDRMPAEGGADALQDKLAEKAERSAEEPKTAPGLPELYEYADNLGVDQPTALKLWGQAKQDLEKAKALVSKLADEANS